ncbi:MAG: aspartate kinase, partial [Mariniphaga sp.]|nr:aspartate kinase [Mariniphaga sp.]
MKVLKFGGTSVGSPENMRATLKIITNGKPKIVVLSAMAGTTNALVEISENLKKEDRETAGKLISKLESGYEAVVHALFKTDENKKKGKEVIETSFNTIKSFIPGKFTKVSENAILAQGELMSTQLFALLMVEEGYNTKLISALEYMRIDEEKMADFDFIRENIQRIIQEAGPATYYITQGYICRNADGEIDNLQRGGSDYTASLIGAAIDADEIQIWTDIDGFHDNDPRFVENTSKIDQLSFNEAAELAYFGAKILHPQTVFPAYTRNIPVRLKNTMSPSDSGTLITAESTGTG